MERQAQEEAAQAIAAGERVNRRRTQEQAEKALERYRRRAERLRAGDIGTNEGRRAVAIAIEQTMRQAVVDGLLDPQKTRKRWQNMHDGRVRHAHLAIPALNPEGVSIFDRFQTGDGRTISHPHDPTAAADLTANCRCWLSYEMARVS
jgi:hypothetical protein